MSVLICGALSQALEALLLAAGLQVVPNTCGPVEEVANAYLSGRLTEGAFLMPGCCRRRRRVRRGRPSGRLLSEIGGEEQGG